MRGLRLRPPRARALLGVARRKRAAASGAPANCNDEEDEVPPGSSMGTVAAPASTQKLRRGTYGACQQEPRSAF